MIRHREVSRLEGFSETPMTQAELRNTAGSFVPFALTFAMVAWIWYLHRSGVVMVFGAFLLLHLHAWRKRGELDLDASELLALRFGARGHMISTGLGVVSLILVALMPHQTAFAGVLYGLMGPLHGWNGYNTGRAKAALAAAPSTQHPAPSTQHRAPR